jgi:hypothetical protein
MVEIGHKHPHSHNKCLKMSLETTTKKKLFKVNFPTLTT